MSTLIIDAHVHLGAWRHPAFAGVEANLETILRELRPLGVSGLALTASDEADNGGLITAGRACPLAHWLFLWARPGDDSLGPMIEKHRETISGLKIHPSIERLPLDDPRWDPVLDLARAFGLRLMVHTGRWQETAGFGLALRRAAAFPHTTVILSHAGGDTPALCLAAAEAVQTQRLDNVAFDTSGLREHWALVRALKRAGHERYMMGSDFPLAHPAMYIAQYQALPVPDAWKEDLLGRNALRLLGPPSRPAAEVVAPMPRCPEIRSDPTATTVLITGAGGPIGVNLTRSLRLARRPLRLIGTDVNPTHRPLALTDCCLPIPRAGSDEYLPRIQTLVKELGVEVIVPTHPVEVRALSLLRDKIPCRLFLPPHQTILDGQNKHRSYELFCQAGVPVPRSIRVDSPDDIARIFDELGPPPIWLRGAGVPGAGIGVASLPVRDPGVARAWVEHHRGYGLMMASEYLPGDNLTWLSIWHEGTLFASQTRERLEYVIPHVSPSGITGAPAVARTVARPDVRRAGEAAVRAVSPDGPHGIFFVDLKCDGAGEPRVTEINCGRFGTTLHFYTVAGFNFPELALELALGHRPSATVQDPIPPDLYWIRTLDCGPVLLPGNALPKE